MSNVINLDKCFNLFDDRFSPKIIEEANGQLIMVVKCEGDKVPWHTHEREDEVFFVIEGLLEIQEKNKKNMVHSGEIYVVNRGIEHRVVPHGLVKLLLIEPKNISHTGKVKSEITKNKFDKLDIK